MARKSNKNNSIIKQDEGECWLCVRIDPDPKYHKNLETHHVFYGTANRKLSDKYGCTVKLCPYHHQGDINGSKDAVHQNLTYDLYLKRYTQKEFEKLYSHEKFIEIFGRSWL